MSVDVSRESSEIPAASKDDGADTLRRLHRIEEKLDELLIDSRAARPLLERYLRMTSGKVGAWVGVSAGQRRGKGNR